MCVRPSMVAVAVAATFLDSSSPARAGDGEPKLDVGRGLFEAGGVLAANAVWYWLNTDGNVEDWDLNWDWESWNGKLFSMQYVRFDTNSFPVNAVTHPFVGLLYYQAGRANGFGMLASTAVNAATAFLWEYVAEFREEVSMNDLITNTVAGYAASEALVQVGRTFRRMRGPAAFTLGLIFTPFESAHEIMDARQAVRLPPPWHRFRTWGAGGVVRFGDVELVEEVAGADLEVVARKGYGEAGEERSGWTDPGDWSRVEVELALGRDAPGVGIPGLRVATHTTLLGHHAQALAADGRGSGRLLGLGAGFLYETRRLADEPDRLMVAELFGPRIELARWLGGATLRLELGAYADFALVQAMAFGPVPPFDGAPPYTTPLRRYGYYFAIGASMDARLLLEMRHAELELAATGHLFTSIDGRDRIEMDAAPEDPHDITDQRLFTRVQLVGYPWGGTVGLGARFDGALRRGAWADLRRDGAELRGLATLVLRFE